MADTEKSPPILRQISIKSVMSLLVQGARSRSDLARETALSKQTMSDVIRALEEAGWVRASGRSAGGMGRAAVLYEVDPGAASVLGLDIGASRFRLSLSDALGRPLGTREMRTDNLRPERLPEEIAAHGRELAAATPGAGPLRFACLATPGVVNPETGQIAMAPNLPALAGIDLAAALRALLGAEAMVENDVNCAVLGESWAGAARHAGHVAYLGIGTGVGLGLVADGRLLRGAGGAAGEVAYLPIGADSLDPASIERGTLERALGLQTTLAPFRDPRGAAATVEAFRQALAAGTPEAQEVLGRIAELAAKLALSVQAMFDPEVMVIGGMLGLVPEVAEATRHELARRSLRPARLEPAGLGLGATVTGAAFLALSGLYNQVFSPRIDSRRMDEPWPFPPPG